SAARSSGGSADRQGHACGLMAAGEGPWLERRHKKRRPKTSFCLFGGGWHPAPNLCNSAALRQLRTPAGRRGIQPLLPTILPVLPRAGHQTSASDRTSSISLCGIEPVSASTHLAFDQVVTNRSRMLVDPGRKAQGVVACGTGRFYR